MAVTFSPASEISMDTLVGIFNTGYAGYTIPVQLETDLMQRHIDQNDIDLSASRVAWVDDELVGVALLAQRGTRGWIGGLGIASSHRRQGIGRQLMKELLQIAQDKGLSDVQLEVIEGNDGAFKLYESLGFVVTRRLLILQGVQLPEVSVNTVVKPATVDAALAHFEAFHTVPNPWQRERESIEKLASTMQAWVASEGDQEVAYVIGRSTARTIHIVDAACAEGEGATLRALLTYLHRQQPGTSAQFANVGEDDPVWPILSTLGYEISMSQFEMRIPLES